MSDRPTISIIIPVYNAEAFIARAIDSCWNQSYKDFELILVNDGSSDNSLQIIQKYAIEDDRIYVVDIPNSGVVKAREYGVNVAKGVFLLFMDADDELAKNALQTLVNAIKPDIDMVIGDINQIEVDGSSSIIKYGNIGCVTGQEHFNWIVHEHLGFLWGKLIRKSLMDEIKVMPYGVKFCEDYIQMIQMSYNARKVIHVGTVTYNYIQQDESACNKALPVQEYAQRFADLCKKISDIIEVCMYDDDSNVKLKVLFLYYCRLYLCCNGRWKPNGELRKYFVGYLSNKSVCTLYKSTNYNQYVVLRLAQYLHPLIAFYYRSKLRKCGRII